jgi:spore germination protein GerM
MIRLGLGAVLLLGSSACGIHGESAPRPLDAAAAPFREVRQAPTPAPTGTGRALVYLVQDGRLVAVTRRVPAPPTPAAALAALQSGPTGPESDAGLTTSVPAGSTLNEQPSTSTNVNVDVPLPVGSGSGRSDEVLGYAQVVLTLTSVPGVTSVHFLRRGQSLDVPRGDGSLTSTPLTRRDYASLL